ncbi:MAG: SBBP repeat-containing protein, partial [Bacteroidota bacterium]
MKKKYYTLLILFAFIAGINSVGAINSSTDTNLVTNLWANYYESKFSPAPKKEQTNQEDLKEKVKGYLAAQPVKFLENKGQMMDMNNKPVPFVLFKAEAPGMNVYITEKGLTYVFVKAEEEEHEREREKEKEREKGMPTGPEEENMKMEMAWVNVNLEGANIQRSNIVKEGQSTEHFNYFYGHCPEGIYDVYQYDKITIKEVYPGIDWVLYNSQKGGMKYDFVVHPGADASQIKMLYEGENALQLKEDGSIDMQTQLGMFSEAKPYSYQEGGVNEIKSAYKLTTINKHQTRLQFNLGQHNQNSTLIIDPQLVWSTYYGGSNGFGDASTGLASDLAGNIFATGFTSATNFPVLNAGTYFQASAGSLDAFILKFNNNGVLLWGTYYGGSSYDQGMDIACDNNGNVFVIGYTESTNFPVFNPAGGAYFQGANAGGADGFILKFNNSGLRLWATYYGGSISAFFGGPYTCPISLTCDNSGNVFVTGETTVTNLPVFNPGGGAYFQGLFGGGNTDAFILKFSNSGVRLWATYYGGSGFGIAGSDGGYSIDCDNSGNVFVGGSTRSTSFPVLNAGTFFQGTIVGWGENAIILKFNNSGVRQWATYYGGFGAQCTGIACDNSGNVFAVGFISGTGFSFFNPGGGAYFQGTLGGLQDVFIVKFDNTGNCLWSTYYGGSGQDFSSFSTGGSHSIAFDACQNVYIVITTGSTNMPTQSYQAGCGGFNFNTLIAGASRNVFLLKFTNTGQLLWATYIGPHATSNFSNSLVCDINNNIFLSGYVFNNGYPTANPGSGAYYNGALNGSQDAYFMKFAPIPPTYQKTQTNPTSCNCNGVATISVTCGEAPYTYQWSNSVVQANVTNTTSSITGLCPGVYQVTVTSSCNFTYTTSYTLTGAVSNLTVNATVQNANCTSPTGSVIINSVTNGVPNYTLAEASTTLAVGFNTPYTLSNVIVGTHTYVLTSANGCNTTFTAQILPGGSQPNITATGPVTLNCVPNTT